MDNNSNLTPQQYHDDMRAASSDPNHAMHGAFKNDAVAFNKYVEAQVARVAEWKGRQMEIGTGAIKSSAEKSPSLEEASPEAIAERAEFEQELKEARVSPQMFDAARSAALSIESTIGYEHSEQLLSAALAAGLTKSQIIKVLSEWSRS